MSDIRVRYWAGAKAAAGTAEDTLAVDGPISLAEVMRRAEALHPGKLAEVLGVCSTLVDDTRADRDALVHPGQSVEFLPPFAGG